MDEVVELTLSRSIEVTHTSHIRASVQNRMKAEGRESPPIELMHFHVFIHCLRGKGRHMVDFTDHEVVPGTSIWIRPGQVQRWSDIDDGFDATVVVFASSSLPDVSLLERFIDTTGIVELDRDADKMQQLMAWMETDLRATGDHEVAVAIVGAILRLFLRNARTHADLQTTRSRQLAMRFLESVESNIQERSVAWHAQRIGASPRTVARATNEALGQRPKEVLDDRVILEAQRRLAWSDAGVATIARELRFSEVSNFTKFFRSRTGVSPSAFRQNVNAHPK